MKLHLKVWKHGERQTLTYREGQEAERERDRRDFLLAGFSVEIWEEREEQDKRQR